MRGSITRLLTKQGFGFILGEDGCEVYFQRSGLKGLDMASLSVGQWVEFEVRDSFPRPRAVNIAPLPGKRDQTENPLDAGNAARKA